MFQEFSGSHIRLLQVFFVQEFCNLSKHLQPVVRSQLFRCVAKQLKLLLACLTKICFVLKIRGSYICSHLLYDFSLFCFELIKRKTKSLLQGLCLDQLGLSAISEFCVIIGVIKV